MLITSLFNHLHGHGSSSQAPVSAGVQPAGVASRGSVQSAAANSTGGTDSGGSTASANSGSISANDFLSLLVTEIQNQDPTSQTDPMTYITQLVGVNSLQQLIQINSTLSAGASATSPATPVAGVQSNAVAAAGPASAAASQGSAAQSVIGIATHAAQTPGPFAVNAPATAASSSAVAQAFAQPAAMPVAPPTQVPLNPAVLRALESSIPGAKLAPAGSQ